jgi:hypothetical protein
MDHKEQHHQHHQKEREQEIKEHKAHERAQGKKSLPHPGWFVGVGVVLILIAVLIWTFLIW